MKVGQWRKMYTKKCLIYEAKISQRSLHVSKQGFFQKIYNNGLIMCQVVC